MGSNFVCKQKLFHPGPTVVVGRHAAGCFVRISTQEIEDGTPQFSRISLQVIKEINAKPVWMNVTFPSRDDCAGVRAQEHPSPEHIPIDFVDIGYVECFDLVVMHFHGQVRPQSLNWITRQENYL